MVDFNQELKTVTGQTVVGHDQEPMSLGSFCIEMLCAQKQDKQDTAEIRVKKSVIAHKLVEKTELKEEEIKLIGDCIKEFGVVSVLVPALKMLGLPIE